MYLATAIAGLSASYKDTPLWRLKKQVLRKPLPWLVASRENSWDALIKYPEPHVFNWTRWGLAAGTQPDVFRGGPGERSGACPARNACS
jgi:hypothetical protein